MGLIGTLAEFAERQEFSGVVSPPRRACLGRRGWSIPDSCVAALPPEAAVGYLEDGPTNVLHLPIRGAGDGSVHSTVGDVERFWTALFAGNIVSLDLVKR